jgi:glucose/arabinose dehydrogenase
VDSAFVNSGGNANSRALLGKMLRLDIDGSTAPASNGLCADAADGSANYAIPATNPFIGNDPQTACDEVWAYGLRNPWALELRSRIPTTLIIGDVGQDRWEEVN